jgi:hypothetical protein
VVETLATGAEVEVETSKAAKDNSKAEVAEVPEVEVGVDINRAEVGVLLEVD